MIPLIGEYRNKERINGVLSEIRKISRKNVVFMEVCGGHTMAIHKSGIPSLLPGTIKLLSGPGCPVCVTSKYFIDEAAALAGMENTIIATFGDLIRVPGSLTSLAQEKTKGRDIRMVYSPLDALTLAYENPEKQIVFLGIGFETTTPSSAAALLEAEKSGLTNFYLLSAHKVMPPAMSALIDEGVRINGYICPGHVSTIAGSEMFRPLVEKYGIGCVVSGFEPLDILQTIYLLVKQCEANSPGLENQYIRAVTGEGNKKAITIMNEVFEPSDDWWRGLGIIPDSGLKIKNKYAQYDAHKVFAIDFEKGPEEEKGCRCGDVLKGMINPPECPLFSKICVPSNPVGACMVSSEGACAAWYRYSGGAVV